MFSYLANWARSWTLTPLDLDAMRRQAEQAAATAESRCFNVGLSMGQGAQPTGIAVLEKYTLPGGGAVRQYPTYVCRYLRRWLPPATAYPALAADLKTMFATLPGANLVVESGASIKASMNFLRRQGLGASLKPVEVKVSAPDALIEGAWRVGKGTLIETTRQVLQEQRLVFDDQMPPEVRASTPSVQTVYHALLTYPFNQAAAANEAFAARDGEYDDLVLAVTLACWFGERCQRRLNIWC